MLAMCAAAPMRFEWDEDKNRLNLRKHQVRFARLRFESSTIPVL